MHVRPVVSLAAVLSLGCGVPASAEILYLTSGRTMSVSSHEVRGDLIVVKLREGGEAQFDRMLVARIAADEVPYPDPMTRASAAGEEGPRNVPYAALIESLCTAYGVDSDLVKALIKVESGYRVKARSPKGAMGLMQIMPSTARQYSVRNPYDPKANLEAGIAHLASLLSRFEISVALAAYNAGEAAVRRFGGIPPYRETRDYVRRIMTLVSR
jgi:soluble lytic murein transglycosylase-like protein